jgi:hypothetical protein
MIISFNSINTVVNVHPNKQNEVNLCTVFLASSYMRQAHKVFSLLCKVVKIITRTELKPKCFNNFSQNSPILNLTKIGLSVLDLYHVYFRRWSTLHFTSVAHESTFSSCIRPGSLPEHHLWHLREHHLVFCKWHAIARMGLFLLNYQTLLGYT